MYRMHSNVCWFCLSGQVRLWCQLLLLPPQCTVTMFCIAIAAAVPLGSDVRTPGLPARQHSFTRGLISVLLFTACTCHHAVMPYVLIFHCSHLKLIFLGTVARLLRQLFTSVLQAHIAHGSKLKTASFIQCVLSGRVDNVDRHEHR